jgi:DNA polymerase-3 subunit epsilon
VILGRLRSPERRRQAAAQQAPPGPLRDFLSTPPPGGDTLLADLPLLAVDIETTGLDAARDHVLAIGWAPVDGASIDLSGARRLVLRAEAEVGQSATIHGLTDDDLAQGVPPVQALEEVLRALTGRVLLAHHASIETDFLATACRKAFGVPLLTGSVDTLVLQHRLLTEGAGAVEEPRPGALRLWAARERYGLPLYQAHEPLTDAIACAELYLAQTAELALRSRRPLTLKAVRSG